MDEKGTVIHLTDNDFDTEVKNAGLPVLVDFWAPWCGPCRMLAPVLDSIALRFAGRLRVAKVNVDENPNLASRFGIMSIPTLVFLKEGREVERMVGAMPEGILAEKLEKLLG